MMKVQRLVERGEFRAAENALNELLLQHPDSILYNVYLADLKLKTNGLDCAHEQYSMTRKLLEAVESISPENRRFLSAYINFRTTAIGFEKAGKEFDNWKGFARQINLLKADKVLKSYLLLPE